MNVSAAKNQAKDPLIHMFEQALLSEFYGWHVFEKEHRENYLFAPDETGDSVWLMPSQPQDQTYEARLFKDEMKQPLVRQVVPWLQPFEHSVRFDPSMLEDRIQDVENAIGEGGRDLAQRINRCFVDVLMTSVSNSRVQTQGGRLEEFLARVADELIGRGFNADRFLFPKRLKNRLLLSVISPDDEIQNVHYVGITNTGLKAFWSTELPDNTALVFDSSAGVVIVRDPRYWCGRGRGFCIEVGGRLEVNLILKDTEAIVPIAIAHLEPARPRTFVREISCLLARGTGTFDETRYFGNKRHEELVEELRDYFDIHRPLLGSSHVEITQALNDRGTDLLLQREECKIGFKIKSHFDIRQSDFSANVKRQLAESNAHGLDKWYLLICSPVEDQRRDYSERITQLLNELSTYKTDYAEAYAPRNTIKYFNSPTPLSSAQFDLCLQR